MSGDAPLDDAAVGGDPRLDERPSSASDPNADLGFGSVVSRDSRQRLLNRDGTFNVRRKGLGLIRSQSAYHKILETTWPRFFGLVTLWYVAMNAVFGAAYMALGPQALPGLEAEGVHTGFAAYFFFSVHTLATIGYGHVVPSGTAANLLVTVESLVGLLAFGLAAGLMFARFARPNARILFSDVALMAPYRGGTGFMFRITNGRPNQIVQLQARLVLTLRKAEGSGRAYHMLPLERDHVIFFPLAWTVVHPVDEGSPLHGLSADDLVRQDAEFLVLLTGFDETFSQTVHARSSYRAGEIVWGRRFADMFDHDVAEGVAVDVDRLSETVE